ncbi:MAG: hypothetical protein JNK04_14485, partial [Myxococcales bacterium]|nr:hypothetical protein [Myxococcales bacterium]
MRSNTIACALFAITLGCGDAPPPLAALPPPCPTERSRKLPVSALKLGHFITADGVTGFVLDRTRDPARIRFDEEAAVFQLTMEELRAPGAQYLGVSFLTPSGKSLVRVSKEGQIELSRGTDIVPVVRDGDAEPLPTPTVTGVPRARVDESARLRAELTKQAVVTRFAGVTIEDSYRLDVIERVLGEAPEELLVSPVDGDLEVEYLPSEQPSGGSDDPQWRSLSPFTGLGVAWAPSAEGLGRFGVVSRAHTNPEGYTDITLTRLDGYPESRLPAAPGVVWAVQTHSVVFLTADGGRYGVPIRQVEPGGRLRGSLFRAANVDPATWPARVEHLHLSESAIRYRSKIGELEQQHLASTDAAEARWLECTRSRWAAIPGMLDQLALYSSSSVKDRRLFDERKWSLRPRV